jgi:hypothetical protein
VNGDLACVHYSRPTRILDFFRSEPSGALKPDETTIFFLDTPEQEQEMPNSSVIQFSEAVEVVKDFFRSKELPKSIEWFEL